MNEVRIYRGKRTDNGEWIYGYYCPCCFGLFPCRPAIISKYEMDNGCWRPVEVDPETVGQYIGKTDGYDEKIFDGDVVEYKNDSDERGKIVYNEDTAMYEVEFDTWVTDFDHIEGFHLEVIGNIHDDPEFLD